VEANLLMQVVATVIPVLIGMLVTSVRIERRLSRVESALDAVKELKADHKSLRGWVGKVDKRVTILEARE
jgi:hypothetical protein